MRIRLLTHGDLAFVEELRTHAGWNQTREDLACLVDYQPDGCFLAESGGESVGIVTTTCYGTDLAWIGMLLVSSGFRRRGIGSALLRRSLEYLARIVLSTSLFEIGHRDDSTIFGGTLRP